MFKIGASILGTSPTSSVSAAQSQALKFLGISSSSVTSAVLSVPKFNEITSSWSVCTNATEKRTLVPGFRYSQDPGRKANRRSGPLIPKIQLLQVGITAEEFLGKHKFSIDSSLENVFENFNEIIKLFTLRNSHEEHPLFFLSLLLEAEAKYRQGTTRSTNPFPLWRSMMTLLATEMFGYADKIKEAPSEAQKVSIDRNVRMGKIAEIAHITQQIHRRILDSDDFPIPPNPSLTKTQRRHRVAELHSANKTATLVGDLLWAQICAHMAALKCQTVSELICEFLMDYCEGEFVFNQRCAGLDQFSTDSWFRKTQLGLGSIMGTTISATLLFSGHHGHIRDSGYKLGVLLALTYQAYADIMFFRKEILDVPQWLDMGLMPIMQKINKEPNLLKESPSKIFQEVRNDVIVLAESTKTLQILQEDTLSYIEEIGAYVVSIKARDILQQFVISLSPS